MENQKILEKRVEIRGVSKNAKIFFEKTFKIIGKTNKNHWKRVGKSDILQGAPSKNVLFWKC